ncbi:MAG TPA: type II toxin-antitoxin system VapC family toxin [Gemmataceae bacterium]|nr:type II toxin-antitoxin system VapC family toxin [Gemmataceae bacterium]
MDANIENRCGLESLESERKKMVLLDTDHLSILEWQDSPAALQIQARMEQHSPEEVGTSIVNFEEKMRGWMAFLANARKIKEQIEVYRRLNQQLRLFRSISFILEFDENAAVEFQRLKKDHPRLGTMDLKIAAIALVHHATLVSRNERDFRQIPGLDLEDWTKIR